MERLHSLFGFVAILGAAWALCPKDRRRNVNRRTLGFGIVLLVVRTLVTGSRLSKKIPDQDKPWI